jgi:hypothetical protein
MFTGINFKIPFLKGHSKENVCEIIDLNGTVVKTKTKAANT